MTQSLAFQPRPRAWSIEPGRDRDGRPAPALRIGSRRVAISEITGTSLETVTERDSGGLAFMGALFGCGAMLFLLLVTVFEWRTRFLIGTTFLGALALAGFGEAWRANRITLYRMHIHQNSGETVFFASADAAEIAGLRAAIEAKTGLASDQRPGDTTRRAAA